jgi:NAD(P)-dependent dehydrogenase (short-subunit alcohol dehydrogenase family)
MPFPFTDPLFTVEGKVVLVTGAASGLGKAIATVLSKRGCRVILTDRDEAGLAETERELAAETFVCRSDITREDDVDALIGKSADHFGRIDAVVNSAGLYAYGPALDMEMDIFRRLIDVNVNGALLLSIAVARKMGDKGGRIIHLASVSGIVANVNYAAYATSKAALVQMVRVLAREWAPRGILVNAIGPAMTETNLSRSYLADPVFREQTLAAIPLGRFGSAEDLMGTIILLLSPAGAFITGQTIYVDGGRTLV